MFLIKRMCVVVVISNSIVIVFSPVLAPNHIISVTNIFIWQRTSSSGPVLFRSIVHNWPTSVKSVFAAGHRVASKETEQWRLKWFSAECPAVPVWLTLDSCLQGYDSFSKAHSFLLGFLTSFSFWVYWKVTLIDGLHFVMFLWSSHNDLKMLM